MDGRILLLSVNSTDENNASGIAGTSSSLIDGGGNVAKGVFGQGQGLVNGVVERDHGSNGGGGGDGGEVAVLNDYAAHVAFDDSDGGGPTAHARFLTAAILERVDRDTDVEVFCDEGKFHLHRWFKII